MGYGRGYGRGLPARFRRRQIIIAAIVVIVLVALGGLRYASPLLVARSFLTNVYQKHYADALQQVCPDQRDAFNNEFTVSHFFGTLIPTSVDASQLSYDIDSESITESAVSARGTVHTILGDFALNGHLTLQATGLSWCVSAADGT